MRISTCSLAVFVGLTALSGQVLAQSSESIGALPSNPGTPSAFASPNRVPSGTILFDEYTGRFITNPTGGSGGAPVSELQSALSMTTLGAGAQIASNNWVADDFVVPAQGWSINTIRFYSYQSFSGTTSTINDLRIQIFSGTPGGTVVFGDTTTNQLSTTTFSTVFRAATATLTNPDRPVMEVVATLATPLDLTTPGTYWIAWSLGGTAASGPWVPPQTVLGNATSGNCQQSIAGAAFAPLLDGGSLTAQGCPFVLEGGTLPVSLQSFSVD